MSKKYSNRLRDLKEMRKALNFFEEKIKFTYEPVPDVFEEISHKIKENIGEIFQTFLSQTSNVAHYFFHVLQLILQICSE